MHERLLTSALDGIGETDSAAYTESQRMDIYHSLSSRQTVCAQIS